MGDSLKIDKERRRRSSSSLTGVVLDGTRSERKIDIKFTIPEHVDQFALAEARCDDLQEKIDLVKNLKRKKKLKRRSITRMAVPQPVEEVPFISVRTQPKKRMATPVLPRMHRTQPPAVNRTHRYIDPAVSEQVRMLDQVHSTKQQHQNASMVKSFLLGEKQAPREQKVLKPIFRRARPDGGDKPPQALAPDVACRADDGDETADECDTFRIYGDKPAVRKPKVVTMPKNRMKQPTLDNRRYVPREFTREAPPKEGLVTREMPLKERLMKDKPLKEGLRDDRDRSVVELFHKNDSVHSSDLTRCNSRDQGRKGRSLPKTERRRIINHLKDHATFQEVYGGFIDEDNAKAYSAEKERRLRPFILRNRRYEQPTVASTLKRSSRSICSSLNSYASNIPFVISKSCGPSHNIGVNIQQVLNGLKIQQPLSGIPLTIAHHMGLGHLPLYTETDSNTTRILLENREINAIRLGRHLLRLPSYKYISYNRLLSMYREGDGMVSRFLKAISRPHRFYNSMFNLVSRAESPSMGVLKSLKNQEAKRSLEAYAALYREYEQVDTRLKECFDPDLERRRDELLRLLTAKEESVRKVVQEYRNSSEKEQTHLRASASTADDAYRLSSYKLNLVDAQ